MSGRSSWLLHDPPNPRTRLKLIGTVLYLLVVITGLGGWTLWLAATGHSWEEWATGTGALALIVVGLIVAVRVSRKPVEYSAWLVASAATVATAGLGWLTVSFTVAQHHLDWETWLFASLVYAVPLLAVFLLKFASRYWPYSRVEWAAFFIALATPAITTGGAAWRLAFLGHPGLAWIPGGVAISYAAFVGLSGSFVADIPLPRLASASNRPRINKQDLWNMRVSIVRDLTQDIRDILYRERSVRDEDVILRVQAMLSREFSRISDQLATQLPTTRLTPENLTTLGRQVSNTVQPTLAEQVREATQESRRELEEAISRVQREALDEVQRTLRDQVREAVRVSLEESVLGPPLANFAGYVAIELDSRSMADDAVMAGGGVIRAPAGHEVFLTVTVARDERALAFPATVSSPDGKPFYMLEPFDIQGGTDSAVADFTALAESPTLTPLPHRKEMRVRDKVQAAFHVKLPAEPGSHEAWFELYQGGRLIQATAIRVEASSTVTE